MKTFLLIILAAVSVSAFAADRFSGHLSAGAAVINTDDKLFADENSRNEDFGTVTKIFPVISGEIRFKITDSTEFHLGSPKFQIKPEPSMGITTEFGDGSSLDAALTWQPLHKEWENPYAGRRDKTDSNVYGIHFDYRNIAGSKFFAEADFKKHDVDSDLSGDLYPELRRDGTQSILKLGYTFGRKINSADVYLTLGKNDSDGDAESSKTAGIGAAYKKLVNTDDFLVLLGEISKTEFDAENPYFNDTREDTDVLAAGLYIFNNVLGMKDKFFTLSAGYKGRSSNIGFFDSGTFFAAAAFGFNF